MLGRKRDKRDKRDGKGERYLNAVRRKISWDFMVICRESWIPLLVWCLWLSF